MDLLSGTINNVLEKLDEEGLEWRDQPRTSAAGVNQVHRVSIDRDRVFYVNEVGPGKNVSVFFAPPSLPKP